jgi:hypothetical protein
MHRGQKWCCANKACRAEIVVTRKSNLRRTDPPRCGCGFPMKREYEKPLVRKVLVGTGEFIG